MWLSRLPAPTEEIGWRRRRQGVERCDGRLPGSSGMDSRHQGPEARNQRRYQACAPESSGMVTNGHIYSGRDQRIMGHSGRVPPTPHHRARRNAMPERIRMAEETLARRPTITASGISGPQEQESRATPPRSSPS